jgi:hypothetical protein
VELIEVEVLSSERLLLNEPIPSCWAALLWTREEEEDEDDGVDLVEIEETSDNPKLLN